MGEPEPEPDDTLAALDMRVVTVTEDEHGLVAINHQGMNEIRALWLLESAKLLLLAGYWGLAEADEDAEDD